MATLADIQAELADLDDQEKLEFLIDVSGELPPVAAEHGAAPFPAECRVQECQTPVHLWVTVRERRVRLEIDVPRNSPTVRGLAALIWQLVDDRTVEDVLSLPEDLLAALGLQKALGMTRQQGVRGVMARIRREVSRSE